MQRVLKDSQLVALNYYLLTLADGAAFTIKCWPSALIGCGGGYFVNLFWVEKLG
jgi:hypothetical protein